ncbi:MAG: hypothetical protein K6A67_00605 [Bacteroidales bacterium]|nr:hypothetical protein [Bacteroidales bacterium]
MDNTNEQNREMTAQESLSLITETLNNTRKEITRNSGKYFIFWGILLTIFSLLIYLLCKFTDKDAWNWLWFAMPAIGIPTERFLRGKEGSEQVRNDVSRFVSGIWSTFGFFACAVGAFTLIYTQVSSNFFRLISAVNGLTAELVLLFGLAECITGVALKNWVIKTAGFITGIGGLAIYYVVGSGWEPLLIFTFAGLVLMATGLIVKIQYK